MSPKRSSLACVGYSYSAAEHWRGVEIVAIFVFMGLATASEHGRKHTMINITARAAEKVLEIAGDEGLEGQGLRLRVIGGGCAGFNYDLYFEESPTSMDERFEDKGVQMFVDPLSFQYLDGTEIDYVEQLHGAGFKFSNPNVTSTCGCGSSFSV